MKKYYLQALFVFVFGILCFSNSCSKSSSTSSSSSDPISPKPQKTYLPINFDTYTVQYLSSVAPKAADSTEANSSATTQNGKIYYITKSSEVKWLIEHPTAVNSYLLLADINISTTWVPIGKDTTNAFSGIFDGNNHSVSGLTSFENNQQWRGFFGVTKNATIKNLTVNLNCTETKYRFGGIVGVAFEYLNIKNCTTNGKVLSSCGDVAFGGIIGELYASANNSTIEDCVNNCSVTYQENPSSNWGGIVGLCHNCIITNCINNGNLTMEHTYYSNGPHGGICGYAANIDIVNCINKGNIEYTGRYEGNDDPRYVGGILAEGRYKVNLYGCVNYGNITANTYSPAYIIGGIVGSCMTTNDYSVILGCCNFGVISGFAKEMGGICGAGRTAVIGCYNSGNIYENFIGPLVSRGSYGWLGGISGNCNYIVGCYNSGVITHDNMIYNNYIMPLLSHQVDTSQYYACLYVANSSITNNINVFLSTSLTDLNSSSKVCGFGFLNEGIRKWNNSQITLKGQGVQTVAGSIYECKYHFEAGTTTPIIKSGAPK